MADFLKLDKSFVDHLATRLQRRAICSAIVTMAHQLGFKVVAEGVESEPQRALLEAVGAEFLQGYLFARPMLAADLQAWAGSRNASAPRSAAEQP